MGEEEIWVRRFKVNVRGSSKASVDELRAFFALLEINPEWTNDWKEYGGAANFGFEKVLFQFSGVDRREGQNVFLPDFEVIVNDVEAAFQRLKATGYQFLEDSKEDVEIAILRDMASDWADEKTSAEDFFRELVAIPRTFSVCVSGKTFQVSQRLTAMDVLRRYSLEENLPQFAYRILRDVNEKGEFGDTALHTACVRGDLDEIEALVHGGANLDLQGEFGMTPLHAAIMCGNAAAARLLLDSGARTDIRNDDGKTPEEIANIPSEVRKIFESR